MTKIEEYYYELMEKEIMKTIDRPLNKNEKLVMKITINKMVEIFEGAKR